MSILRSFFGVALFLIFGFVNGVFAEETCAKATWINNSNSSYLGTWTVSQCVSKNGNITAKVSVTGGSCKNWKIVKSTRDSNGSLNVQRGKGCGGNWSGTIPAKSGVTDKKFLSPFGELTVKGS